MSVKKNTLFSWGRCQAESYCFRPEKISDLENIILHPHDLGLIAHGASLSYGDQALNLGGEICLSHRLNRILRLDFDRGVCCCEAGVTFAELNQLCWPNHWTVPVSPGTAYITVGGALANDVHGKNHDLQGSFGQHVIGFDLMTPQGEVINVTENSHPEIFRATIAGMGLTGIVINVTFNLMPASTYLLVQEKRISNIEAFIEAMIDVRQKSSYSVGWVDCLASGKHLGRGILQLADPIDTDWPRKERGKPIKWPVDLPGFCLNPITVSAFNALYLRRVPLKGRDRYMSMQDFLYPLDQLLNWNKLYGRQGFYQFQCVVPDQKAFDVLPKLLEMIVSSRQASFLSVIKTLGASSQGYLSFPMPGVTLALDFPKCATSKLLIQQLNAYVASHGGRVYLAKDALLDAALLPTMYPDLEVFKSICARLDPQSRMQSSMSRRLKMHHT